MGLFKKKEQNLIPEVAKPDYGRTNSGTGGPPQPGGKDKKGNPLTEVRERKYGREQASYNPTSNAASYGNYGNYGSYGQQPQYQQPAAGQQPPYQQQQGGYGAGYADNSRSELFKGARAPASNTGNAFDSQYGGGPARSYGSSGPAGSQGSRPEWADDDGGDDGRPQGEEEGEQQGNEEEDEVEAIKQQIRFTKQESLSTTRNAIRTAREAEETATNTLNRLGEQTDRIANTELSLDKAKGYNSRAADGAKEIRRLNQSIFKPNMSFNKQAKRDAEESRILARHMEEKNDREEARQAAYSSRMRVEQGFREAERSNKFGKGKDAAAPTGRAKWEQGGRYQFEASNSDDEIEQELDENLDEIAAITGRLKILASTAGKEIDAQNKHLDKIGGKVDTLDDKIVMNTSYLKRIKG